MFASDVVHVLRVMYLPIWAGIAQSVQGLTVSFTAEESGFDFCHGQKISVINSVQTGTGAVIFGAKTGET